MTTVSRSRPAASPQSSGTATVLAVAGAVVTTVANFGIAILVAQAGAAFAGLFFAATAVITIVGNSTALGTMTGLVYFMPDAIEGDAPNPRGLVAVALRPVVVVSALAAAVVAVAAPALAAIVADSGAADSGAAEITTMLRLLALVIPCWALTVAILGATRGLGSMTPTVVVNQVIRPLLQLVAVATVVLEARRGAVGVAGVDGVAAVPSESAIALAWGGPVVLGLVVAAWSLWRLGGLVGQGPSPVASAEFWAYARPRAASTTFQIALERIDVLLVSALAGPAAAGIYGTLSRFVTAGNFLIFAIGQATSNGLRRALAAGRRAEAQDLLARTTGWMVLLAWPYLLLVAVKAPLLIELVNPDFAEGAPALSLLALAILANALAGPVDLGLLMLGRSRVSLGITVLALTVDVVVAIIAIPHLGLVGAALAWGAAVITQNGLAAFLVTRLGGLSVGGRPALIAAAGAVGAVVPVGLLTADDLLGALITATVAGTLWLGWAWHFRHPLNLTRPPST